MLEEQLDEDSMQKRKGAQHTRIHSTGNHNESGQKSTQKQFTNVIEVVQKKHIGSQREVEVVIHQPPEDREEDSGNINGDSQP